VLWTRCLGLVLLFFAATACGAAEVGRVVKAVDGDTIHVSIGGSTETVRLLGVDAPELGRKDRAAERFARESADLAAELSVDREVVLERDPEGDTRDAYGRLLRLVRLPDGSLLNAEMIRRGYALALTTHPFSLLDEFRSLEREARGAGRGLWHSDVVPRLDLREALSHAGEVVVACGSVAATKHATRVAGAPTFLDLGRPHPEQELTIVIWGADRAVFGEPEKTYRGKRVCVTGKLRLHQGHPQIACSDPSQIEVVPDDASSEPRR
jgi:endonuclease YncB( thermonuclease family)